MAGIFEWFLENYRGNGNFLYSSPRLRSGTVDLDLVVAW
jgi:hypothetical protein